MVLRITFIPVFVDDGLLLRMSNPVPLSVTVMVQSVSSFLMSTHIRLAPWRFFSPCFIEFSTRICMNIDGTIIPASSSSDGAFTS